MAVGRYDLTMKRLTAEFPEDYVRLALKAERFVVEPLEVEAVDRALPSLEREVDFVARVGVEGEEVILVLESQTRWEGDVPERLFHYTSRLRERYRLGVYPVVLVFRPTGQWVEEWVMQGLGRQVVRFGFEVIRLWEVEAREVIERGLKGVYPLLPLMRQAGRGVEEVLEESQRLILEGIEERQARADAYVALRVLSEIGHPGDLVERILHRREIMSESRFYREILEEGRVAGLQEGMEERLREDVLEVLEVRFGRVPPGLEEQVRRLRGRKTLEGLHRRAVLVESLEVFGEELARVEGEE